MAFTEYCLKEDELKSTNYEEQLDFYNAFQYLANYHLQKGNLDDAYTYAFKCLEHEEVLYFYLFLIYFFCNQFIFLD